MCRFYRVVCLLLLMAFSCGDDESPTSDAILDAGSDAVLDATSDVEAEAAPDAASDFRVEPVPDAVTDVEVEGASDLVVDSDLVLGADAATDALGNGPPFPLPVYRIGPRAASLGFFGPYSYSGTFSLPEEFGDATVFEGFQIWGHGPDGGSPTELSPATVEDGHWVASFEITLGTTSDVPQAAREIFSAVSAEGWIMTGVLDESNQLNFSLESTALQALALAGFRAESGMALENTYYFGLAPGDDPTLDDAIEDVVLAMQESLQDAEPSTGVSLTGFALSETPVFAVVDAAIGVDTVDRPSTEAISTGHIGVIHLGGQPGTLGIWLGDSVPSVPATILDGINQVGFFFSCYAITPDMPIYARFRHADGRQSYASTVVYLPEVVTQEPLAPSLEWAGQRSVQACGGELGNWILFMSPSTELGVGFAALQVGSPDSCVTLSEDQVPAEVNVVTAYQITPESRFSAPSESVFF